VVLGKPKPLGGDGAGWGVRRRGQLPEHHGDSARSKVAHACGACQSGSVNFLVLCCGASFNVADVLHVGACSVQGHAGE
jgi:hypothetical protein